MKRTLAVICGTTLLLSSAHRSPAQVVEKKPSPTEAPATSSSKRFDGTWRATTSWKIPVGSTFNQTQTLIIKNGGANFTRELTATLASGKKWNDLPAPYNSSSPIYRVDLGRCPTGSNSRGTLTPWIRSSSQPDLAHALI